MNKYLLGFVLLVLSCVWASYYLYMYDKKNEVGESPVQAIYDSFEGDIERYIERSTQMNIPDHLTQEFWEM